MYAYAYMGGRRVCDRHDLILLHVSSYYYVCPHTTMCPHTVVFECACILGGGDARATHRDVGAFQRSFALRHFSHRERELGGRAPTLAGADPALHDCFTSTSIVALLATAVLREKASLWGRESLRLQALIQLYFLH